jgi:putrescine transport system substrate-binding protein
MPPEIANDPGVYPTPAVAATLFTLEDIPREVDKFRNRIWTRIKTGR